MATPNPPARAGKAILLLAVLAWLLLLLFSFSESGIVALGPEPAAGGPEPSKSLPDTPPVPPQPGLPAVIGPGALRVDGDHPVLTRRPQSLLLGRSRLYAPRPGLEPNELGGVLILMYHHIGEPEGTWQRTPDNLRADLERLYQLGYRAVSLEDYLRGTMDLPAGTSPVVLTFDDGTAGQFRYLEDEDGRSYTDPDCAVGILRAFYEKHPDFGLEATFFINGYAPFGQPRYWKQKLQEVIALGMDLGNHTYEHESLGGLGPQEIASELARCVAFLQQAVPGYQPVALSLPFGTLPPPAARPALYSGEYNGTSYHNLAALLVGARPARSPYAPDFDPSILPRVRASGEYLDQWLQDFEEHPDKRYVSDGEK